MSDDEDDRRKKQDERRHPSEKDETSMPRRARDSGRVRAAIRTELEEVAGDAADKNTVKTTGRNAAQKVISLENISLAFDEPILENVSFAAKEGETVEYETPTGKTVKLTVVTAKPFTG